MKIISLTQDQVALVDDDDFDWLISGFKWCAVWMRGSESFYATRYAGGGRKNGKHELLHRVIMGVTDPKVKVDHKNHNTIDCHVASHG